MGIFGQLPEEPGKIVNEIKTEVRRLVKDGRPDWSKKIKEVLRKLGKEKGYDLYPDAEEKNGWHGEWLLDLIWLDEKTGAIHLAAESELGNANEVLDDFRRLLCAKAALKVMIYYVYNKPFLNKFEDCMTNFDQHVEGEHYLLIEFAPGPTDPADRAYLYQVPNHGRLAKVEFQPLQGH
jgi:hypothetical protein